MGIETKEKTAPVPSVGAEEGQPVHNFSEDSIPNLESEINEVNEKSEEKLEETGIEIRVQNNDFREALGHIEDMIEENL